MTRDQIKDIINEAISDENGLIITDENSLLSTAELDSFGHTVLFLDLDARFGYFNGIEGDPFDSIEWATITLKDIVDKVELCI